MFSNILHTNSTNRPRTYCSIISIIVVTGFKTFNAWFSLFRLRTNDYALQSAKRSCDKILKNIVAIEHGYKYYLIKYYRTTNCDKLSYYQLVYSKYKNNLHVYKLKQLQVKRRIIDRQEAVYADHCAQEISHDFQVKCLSINKPENCAIFIIISQLKNFNILTSYTTNKKDSYPWAFSFANIRN